MAGTRILDRINKINRIFNSNPVNPVNPVQNFFMELGMAGA